MGVSFDDGLDEVLDAARRARGGEFRRVLPELSRLARSGGSVRARMAATVALTDVLVWDDATVPIAADLAEAALAEACGDPMWELVTMWRPLVEVIVGAQVGHGVAARPRLVRLLERAHAGRADRAVTGSLLRRLTLEVPQDGAPASWRSHTTSKARESSMHRLYYQEFRAGPREWTQGRARRLWDLVPTCREGPEVADGLLAVGFEPQDQHRSWLWLVGRFLEEGDRTTAGWALQGYLDSWRDPDVPASVLPRMLPLQPWVRPLLDPATRETVLSSPVGPAALRSTPSRTGGVAGDAAAGEGVVPARRRIEGALRSRCSLDAACVTVVVGSSTDEVLRAFGADPAELGAPRVGSSDDPPGVSVLELPGAVLAVEDNGFVGSMDAVVRASARGRAASAFWNGIGDSAVMFAENGVLLDGGDYLLGTERPADPALAEMIDEIARSTDDRTLIGLLAVEEFTGVQITAPATLSPVVVHRIRE